MPESVRAQLGYERTFIGESRRSLAEKLPCSWFEGVSPDRGLEEQSKLLQDSIQKARDEAKVHQKFRQPTERDHKHMMMKFKKDSKAGAAGASAIEQALAAQNAQAQEYINSMGLPQEIRDSQNTRRTLQIKPLSQANWQKAENFGDREGDKVAVIGSKASKMISGKMEDESPGSRLFDNDFWYKAFPLLTHHDVVDRDDVRDWSFRPETVGFVKCCFKLVDGWEKAEEESADAPQTSVGPRLAAGFGSLLTKAAEVIEEDPRRMPTAPRHVRINQSYGLKPELDEFAFDEKKLRARFKSPEKVPGRVRVRLYLVKAVCTFASNKGDPDPFVEIQLGRNDHMSYRNQAKVGTREPDLYMLEERDIVLPDDSKLEVKILDKDGAWYGDVTIGSTILDLEDRWHSKNWQRLNDRSEVPKESRPLSTRDEPGKNRGTIEMWVEMLDSQKATDCPAVPPVKPAEIELEVRMVIWDTKNVQPIHKKDYVNVQIATTLDCQEYLGALPKKQETDVHYNSKDGFAIFNWRVVFSRIKMPVKTCSVKMDLIHYDLLGSTTIGSLDLDIKKYVERVAANMDAIELADDWLAFSNSDSMETGDDIGQAKVQLFVLTHVEALSKKAGAGRDDPNDYPPLITPAEGRDWGDYFGAGFFKFPEFGMWKKLLPLGVIMVIFLFCVIMMKQMGLL